MVLVLSVECVSVAAAAVSAEYVARERHNIIYVCNCFACTRATHTFAAYNTIIKCKCLLRNGKHQQFNHVPNGVSSRAQHIERTEKKTNTESQAAKNFQHCVCVLCTDTCSFLLSIIKQHMPRLHTYTPSIESLKVRKWMRRARYRVRQRQYAKLWSRRQNDMTTDECQIMKW